jgi:hypothetical protein
MDLDLKSNIKSTIWTEVEFLITKFAFQPHNLSVATAALKVLLCVPYRTHVGPPVALPELPALPYQRRYRGAVLI